MSGKNVEKRSLRMLIANAIGRHSKSDFKRLVRALGGKCVRCGRHESECRLDADHIIPVYQYGSNGIENIQPLCARCNTSKGPEGIDHRPSNWLSLYESVNP